MPDFLEAETNYTVKVKTVNQIKESRLSEEVELFTRGFSEICVWKECTNGACKEREICIDENNLKTVIKTGYDQKVLLQSYRERTSSTQQGLFMEH